MADDINVAVVEESISVVIETGTQSLSGLLKLDQTTPQTIASGIPLLEEDRVINAAHQLVDKLFVESSVRTDIGSRFYMLDTADGDYKLCSITASASGTATVDSSSIVSSTDTLIKGWISPAGMDWTILQSGVYDLNIFAEKMSGNRTCRLFWEFYERKTDTSEVLIATSNLSNVITTKVRLRPYVTLTSDYTPSDDSRLVGKVYVNTVGGGSGTILRLYYQGDENSHWQIPVNLEFLDDNYEKKVQPVQIVDFAIPLAINVTTYKDWKCAAITGATTVNLTGISDGEAGMLELINSASGIITLGAMFTKNAGGGTIDTAASGDNIIAWTKSGNDIIYQISQIVK